MHNYIKEEYKYIVYKKAYELEEEEFWTYELNEEDAIKRVQIETDAYQLPEFQFDYKKI